MTRTRRIAAAVSLPVAAAFATLAFVGQAAAGAQYVPERPGLVPPLLPAATAAAEPDEDPAVDPYEPYDGGGGRGNPGYGPTPPTSVSPNTVPPTVSPNAVPPGPNAVPGEELPVTGVPLTGFAVAGLVLAAGGATMLYVAHRRRLI